jgi:DNA-binding transcriptional LysR family regulator
VGLLSGQDVLTLPSLADKLAAHVAGLGIGFLPEPLAKHEAAAGRLNILPVEIGKPAGEAVIAWRPNRTGKALRWFIQQLESADARANLLRVHPAMPDGSQNAPASSAVNAK